MNILLIGNEFGGDANGICEQNIANEFVSQGHKVWHVGLTQESTVVKYITNGVSCIGIPIDSFARFTKKYYGKNYTFKSLIYRIVSGIRYIMVTFLYPNVSPFRTRRLQKVASELIESEGITLVLCTYRPYDAISTSIYLKSKFKSKIRVVNYHLDLILSPANKSGLIRSIKLSLSRKALAKEFNLIDKLLLPESVPNKIKHSKIEYVDFPLYITQHQIFDVQSPCCENDINVGFAGTLDLNNRNPLYALSILSKIRKIGGKNIKIHIWGLCNSDELKKKICSFDNVVFHGRVQSTEVYGLLSSCDYLLNISNKITYDMIPSKVFQQISVHKPIINFISHPNDKARVYYDKCGYSFNVLEYNDVSTKMISELTSFMIDNFRKGVNNQDELFVKSTPAYICNTILK